MSLIQVALRKVQGGPAARNPLGGPHMTAVCSVDANGPGG